jgi:ABC-type nitrate/sulfonate/bicarbonate transport system substrate-binding protein
MKLRVLVSLWKIHVRSQWFLFVALAISLRSATVLAADKLTAIHSSQSMSQSMPWIAKEAGLFKKYSLDFDLVHIASSPTVTAAMLGGNAEVALTGGEGIIRAYVQGATDFVFIGSVKNLLTHSLLAKPEIKKIEDLKGKKIGINRIGSNPHYFTVQVLRQAGVDTRDVQFIQADPSRPWRRWLPETWTPPPWRPRPMLER